MWARAVADLTAVAAAGAIDFFLVILLGELSKSLISLFTFKLGTSTLLGMYNPVCTLELYGQYQQALLVCLLLLSHQAGAYTTR
jgi:hypothetical protein